MEPHDLLRLPSGAFLRLDQVVLAYAPDDPCEGRTRCSLHVWLEHQEFAYCPDPADAAVIHHALRERTTRIDESTNRGIDE